jgi:hypothetical protein
VSNRNGVSRGDRNRNARLARLQELVPVGNAIVGIDLADKKQMVVVTDHDSKVLAGRTFWCRGISRFRPPTKTLDAKRLTLMSRWLWPSALIVVQCRNARATPGGPRTDVGLNVTGQRR